MKYQFKILGIACVIFFSLTACSSSDEGNEENEGNEKPSVVGVWSNVNGEEFSYLTLLSDNTFIYAENDLTVQSDKENGLEVGSYFYDSDADNIKFNVIYDDNDPGNDSGVGDIGSQVSLKLNISNSKLSLEDGELIFDSEDLNASTSPVVGVWSNVDGTEFSYLTLLANNKFIYAENDLDIQSTEENGLEVGTYSYDSSTNKITFNIVYDDNDPGNDSGVGNSGSPVVSTIILSNGNNTLSIAGLELAKVL
jgi:hypothetical protein